jgi:SNF2 family DNA or RNA helicase
MQAYDRLHRIGQTRVVQVHRLIAANTIEERILKVQKSKQHMATRVVEGIGSHCKIGGRAEERWMAHLLQHA